MGLRIGQWLRRAMQFSVAAALTVALVTLGYSGEDKSTPAKKVEPVAKQAPPKLGLAVNDPKAFQGYTLLTTMNSTKTYLIDMQGRVVRTWECNCTPALSSYLLDNGHLLRPGTLGGEAMALGSGPGAGGRVQEFTWEGELVWDFKLLNEKQIPHHDITRLPNGNVVMIVWDKKTAKEAIAAGRRPDAVGDSHLLPDSLIEIKPTGKTTGQVVWEWHLWDHLIQDHDKSKANYGKVADHPERVNINYGEDAVAPVAATKAGSDKLKSIGYVGAPPTTTAGGRRVNPDWTHFNGVAYNPDLDQLVVSVHAFSEFWIIDHSTTTAEAASHSGGRSGKGGDLLYRWGNPRAYRAGSNADQRLFAQHNAHWIPKGLPGEGHILVFNNGGRRHDGSYSSVDEIVLPVDSQGHYSRKPGTAFGPSKAVWSYTAPKKEEFYSMLISGAQRLANGNTLICSGINGTIFEVTPEKEVVWKYVNPVKAGPGGPGGPGMFGSPPPLGQLVSSFLRDRLKLTAEQKKQLEAFQKEAGDKLDKLFTEEQKKQLKAPPSFGPGGFGGPPQPGQLLVPSMRDRLKLSDDQKKQVDELQKEADGLLAKLLTEEQKKQLKQPQGFGPFGPVVFGGPPPANQILPSFLQGMLKLDDKQKKQVDEMQKDMDGKVDKLLTDEQKKQLKEPQSFGPGGFGGPPQVGQVMPAPVQDRLKVTAEQKKQLAELQKEADGSLDKLFTEEQKKLLKDMRAGFGRGGPGGPGGFGQPGGSSLFRSYRYGPNDPALAGKDLKPGKTVEELEPKEAKKP
jgi:Arylsulfotransferase (ASST)